MDVYDPFKIHGHEEVQTNGNDNFKPLHFFFAFLLQQNELVN